MTRGAPAPPPLHLVALVPDRFADFVALLGGEEFGGCFCAVWTHHDEDWPARCADASRPNAARTLRDLRGGRSAGFLVHAAGEVAAWVGAGPKRDFPFFTTRLAARCSGRGPDQWVLGCLAVAARWRGQGLHEAITRAVVAEARRAGAAWLEACPTDPWDEPRRYRGALSTYRRLGFREVAREKDGETAIVLVERDLSEACRGEATPG